MNWLLPEDIADILPREAEQLESLRRVLLDRMKVYGYEMVVPPLVEFTESLLTGTARDLQVRTFQLVDQASGKAMGVRADITPQVARMDAHLLNRKGVTRLCYCGSVLHATSATVVSSREPMQLGAELYGFKGLEADAELIRLMADLMDLAGVKAARIDLGHVGIFKALSVAANLSSEAEQEIFFSMQRKDVSELGCQVASLPPDLKSAFLALPHLFGDASILERAESVLPELPGVVSALDELKCLASLLVELPLSFDLADLRGYHYHNGVFFAAYTALSPAAIALGGRYDGVGEVFGRYRPATGFSLDLRELVRISASMDRQRITWAPSDHDPGLDLLIANLRRQGEVVIKSLAIDEPIDDERIGQKIVSKDGKWVVTPLVTG